MANRTIRTPEKGARLLAKLAQGYSVSAACRVEGIARRSYYQWREDDPAFAAATDEAIERGTDLLEDAARTRAVKQSDTLLIFLLKARRPEKYAERKKIDVTIRKKAARVAEELGVSVDEVIAEAELVAAEAWDAWSP